MNTLSHMSSHRCFISHALYTSDSERIKRGKRHPSSPCALRKINVIISVENEIMFDKV